MDFEAYGYAFAGFAAAGFLLWEGRRRWRQFLPFFCYMAVCVAGGLINWSVVAVAGDASRAYLFSYYGIQGLKLAAECWILFEVYRQVRARRWGWATRSVQGLIVLLWVRSYGLATPPEFLAIAAYWQWLAVLLILSEIFVQDGHERLQPGWGGILFGAALLIYVKLQVYGQRMAAPNTEEWRAIVQPMQLTPWPVWIASMLRLREPSRSPLRTLADKVAAAGRSSSRSTQLALFPREGVLRRLRGAVEG